MRDRDGEAPVERVHRPPKEPSATCVHQSVHVIERPLVSSLRPMKPNGMVEAHHAARVAFELKGPSARPGPVRRERDQGSVQVRIIGEVNGESKPESGGSTAVRRPPPGASGRD